MTETVKHRIHARTASGATIIRQRIEFHLGVQTTAQPEGPTWAVYFDAPADVDLEFLRPDVLPPKSDR